MTHFVFITGGVVSSLGKGIAAASLGAILEARKLKVTLLKLDPYINLDPGTMSPYQHGEVYVTEDGAETDLDLGHYERFVRVTMTRQNNWTAGRIYQNVIQRERNGDYLGSTVQVIPHITDEIKRCIIRGAKDATIAIVEIGGTVGDIESQPFLEAIRQMRNEYGADKTLFIHLTLIPYIAAAGEIKTKPTQHSVKELRSIGIQPDCLLCRTDRPLLDKERDKIMLFTNVKKEAIIPAIDVDTIYSIPAELCRQNLDDIVLSQFAIEAPLADLSAWDNIINAMRCVKDEVTIAMVGKYTNLTDSYKSLSEALTHASIHTLIKVNITYIDSEQIEQHGAATLDTVDAVLVPGGFGDRGIEGKIAAIRYARENKIPYLGICMGMQLAVIEAARNLAQLEDANSTEFDQHTQHPVVSLVNEWTDRNSSTKKQRDTSTRLGGTMRLGGQQCKLLAQSLAKDIYPTETIIERHRHRYEFNKIYYDRLEQAGLKIAGVATDTGLAEIIEVQDHPWFIACQFHPEFTSTPRNGHPLFSSFVRAAYNNRRT